MDSSGLTSGFGFKKWKKNLYICRVPNHNLYLIIKILSFRTKKNHKMICRCFPIAREDRRIGLITRIKENINKTVSISSLNRESARIENNVISFRSWASLLSVLSFLSWVFFLENNEKSKSMDSSLDDSSLDILIPLSSCFLNS